jgi:hypothetical protein
MSAQDSNRFGAPDSRYPTMSVLITLRSLQASKLESGEEIRFYEAKLKLLQKLKGKPEKFKNP